MNKLWDIYLETRFKDSCWSWMKPSVKYFYWFRGKALEWLFRERYALYVALKKERGKLVDLQKQLKVLKIMIDIDETGDLLCVQAYLGLTKENPVSNNVSSNFFDMSDEEFKKLTPEVTSV